MHGAAAALPLLSSLFWHILRFSPHGPLPTVGAAPFSEDGEPLRLLHPPRHVRWLPHAHTLPGVVAATISLNFSFPQKMFISEFVSFVELLWQNLTAVALTIFLGGSLAGILHLWTRRHHDTHKAPKYVVARLCLRRAPHLYIFELPPLAPLLFFIFFTRCLCASLHFFYSWTLLQMCNCLCVAVSNA